MADQDPQTPAKVDSTRVPGLLDQYRQQREAWLAQADELVRMREEVRQAAEREAIDIVTAARRDVRRIIVDARRELLVLTAQLHAAVEATDGPTLQPPPFTALLADPQARSRVESASHDDIARDAMQEARKSVRTVLDEARAEIEALSAEAPAIFGGSMAGGSASVESGDVLAPGADAARRPADEGNEGAEGPVHELSLDASLAALDFQARDLPIPTLARILGSEPSADSASSGTRWAPQGDAFDSPLAYDTPRLSELRSLLRDSIDPADSRELISPEIEPLATSTSASESSPKGRFFDDLEKRNAGSDAVAVDERNTAASNDEEVTPPSRLFAEDDGRSPARSARMFIGLFAATGALAVIGTIWWALGRDSAPLSAAAPPAVREKTTATAPASAAPAATAAASAPASAVPTSTAPSSASPAVAKSAPGTLALTIEARRPSWIRAQIDGKDEAGRLYQAGETRHIYGARSVSIRAGDAGAVFVGMDGGAARALGGDGVPATKQFTATAAAATPAVAVANDAAPAGANAAATPAVGSARPAVAETTAAPAPRAASPAGSETPAPVRDGVGGGRPDLVQAAQQWLEAYQRRDRESMNAMGTDNVTVSDERSVTERFPTWQSGVQRDLDEVALELTGDVAVFTARMTERAEGGGGQHISRVSQFWQRRSGRWYVTNVRIIGEARLNQIIR